MSSNTKDEEEVLPPQRPPSPPPHTTFAARGIHPPTFSAFKPRDVRLPSHQGMTSVAWNCDGKRLGAVGIDKLVRLWWPDKSLEVRSASTYAGGHSEDVDHLSWNPTHPDLFCTSSQKDKRIVFWDARQSRHIQTLHLKHSPAQTVWSPTGKDLVCITTSRNVLFAQFGHTGEGPSQSWQAVEREGPPMGATTWVTFNHAGDGMIVSVSSEHQIRLVDYQSLNVLLATAAHVGGCNTTALDPRGNYLATGGNDSIVNLFDTTEWLCARTITACDHVVNSISFSHDGEFIAIANSGNYIDICATETGMPLHRVPSLGPAPVVQWHPSKHVIAYCGQSKLREGGPPPSAWISLFGPGAP
ncbi:WD40 repeat-like protein [Trametopsis cervina]|nr:WD40 repeat-like protein [Trametopsis cervina]